MSQKSTKEGLADEESAPVLSVMDEYKEKKAALLRAVLEREERERQEEVSKLNLVTIPTYSAEQLEKLSSGEKSKMRRDIFRNHEIT